MASQRQHDERQNERNARLLEELLRAHRDPLLRQARVHGERAGDAEDALSEASVQFLRFFDGEEEDHALRYLLVVIKRCAWAISRTRRNRRRLAETVSVEDLEAEYGAGIADERRGPEQQLEWREEVRRFAGALNALKTDERRALLLLGLGYSYSEIAEQCGWTRTKVNRCLAEGRQRLRQLLGEGGEMMSSSPLHGMDSVETIDFAAALGRLQSLIGEEVRVSVNFRGTFGGCALEGPLTRIHDLPPDYAAVDILLADRQGLFLDPVDTKALLATKGDDQSWWIEFHLPSGVVASVEQVEANHPSGT